MKRSRPKPETAIERFNGSDVMLSVRESVDERKSIGPHQAIFTVRVASDSVCTRTVTIPLFPERLQADGTVGAPP